MNKEGARRVLEEGLNQLDDTFHLREALAVLSTPCACGDRKPLAVIHGGMTETELGKARHGPDNPFDYWTVGCRGRSLYRPVDIIILSAEEEP